MKRSWSVVVGLVLVAAIGGCAGAPVTSSPTGTVPAAESATPALPPSPTAIPTATAATPTQSASPLPSYAGPLPIVIDTDAALDDIIAIAILLRDPAVDVKAVTVSGTGEAHCSAGVYNVARLLAAFGRAQVPVGCGRETPGPNGRSFPEEWRQAADDMYGLDLPAVAQPVPANAVDLIANAAAASGYLTIVAIGPWTNLADAFVADPGLEQSVAAIHAMGGAFRVPGNIELGETHREHGVEWNLGADPDAVVAVMATSVPITFVPLDATNDVPGTTELAQDLAADHAAAGATIVNELFTTVPYMTSGDWYIWDPLAALSLTDPGLTPQLVAAEAVVSLDGPEAGRVLVAETGGRPVTFAASADAPRVYEALLAALRRGAPLP